MARDLTSGMSTAFVGTTVAPLLLAKIQTSGGDVLVWTGLGNITWNGMTFRGVGTFGGVTPLKETEDLSAQGVGFSLSGIDTDMIQISLAQIKQGLKAYLWLGCLNSSGVLIVDPYQLFQGTTDVPTINEDDDTATITISCENRLVDLERARVRRYTTEDQQIDDPTDVGFDYVPSLQDAQIHFGG